MWALLNSSVEAVKLVVVMEMLDGVRGPAACNTNGISFPWENV